MDVIIDEVVSTVRAVDGESLLDPRTLSRIVEAVTRTLERQKERETRRKADTRTQGGGQDEERD